MPADRHRANGLRSTARGAIVLTSAAGWSSSVARRAHNPKVAGSNPAPATKAPGQGPFPLSGRASAVVGVVVIWYMRRVGQPKQPRWSPDRSVVSGKAPKVAGLTEVCLVLPFIGDPIVRRRLVVSPPLSGVGVIQPSGPYGTPPLIGASHTCGVRIDNGAAHRRTRWHR